MATEKRLIDKKSAWITAQRIYSDPVLLHVIKNTLDTVPTVDAVEVVHGHMVERTVDHECPWYKVYDCSECGCTVEIWHNYCPNCGAKMDGDGNG